MNHVYPCLMPSAHELRIQPFVNNHLRHLDAYNPCAERQDIGIIMLPGQFCGIRFRAYHRPDSSHFICSKRYADPRSADKNPKVNFPGGYRLADNLPILRVIAALMHIRAVIDNLVTFLLKILCDILFHLHCGMVISNSNLHICTQPFTFRLPSISVLYYNV